MCTKQKTSHYGHKGNREPDYSNSFRQTDESLRCSPKVACRPPLDGFAWQTGQHSPSGIIIFSQLLSSSHWISSHRTWPLSHTQIRHGSGFQMSLLVYTWPSAVQLTSSPAAGRGGRTLPLAWLRAVISLCFPSLSLAECSCSALGSQLKHTQGTLSVHSLLVPNCCIQHVFPVFSPCQMLQTCHPKCFSSDKNAINCALACLRG